MTGCYWEKPLGSLPHPHFFWEDKAYQQGNFIKTEYVLIETMK